ncbi:hypothetical protein F383_28689 [Gossypium arboreum]|uniref:Uncharacterized protein n=1 Tax=Gossypium arboreum TaxID=29729 RepID=A0A0B0MTM5_GOSAR|nr:hypothetical protein F383_28689 [Gossypium arboreum]
MLNLIKRTKSGKV